MDKQLLNSKLPKSGLSIFSRMTSLALKNDAVNLAQGFPDFPCPGELSEALYRATQYPFRNEANRVVIWITDITYHETFGRPVTPS